MKLVKIIVAGVVGGILIFMWGFVAHMMLGIGEMGVRPLTEQQEAAILPVVRDNVKAGGFYFMPGMDPEKMKNMSAADSAAYDEKYRAGASGIMVIAPVGETAFSSMPMRLVKELGTDIAAALLGALVIFWGVPRSGLFRTIGMALAQGLMAWFLISTSYNIWFRFPRDYVIGEGITEVAGFAIAGVGFYIVSLFFRQKAPRKSDPLDVSSS